MSVERNRILSLIEFSQQSARLRGTPAATVAAHGLFSIYEHELQGLPGIRINNNATEADDEIWLAVERLHEKKPPDVASRLVRPWVQMSQTPTEEPSLRDELDGATLIAEGTHCSPSSPPDPSRPVIAPDTVVVLSEYDGAAAIRASFTIYLETRWRHWAEEEKRRRKTIRFYSRLFTLKQQLDGDLFEAQLELVWGAGLGIWNRNGTTVSYPLVGRLVEMALNPVTAEIEIRPREVEARIEVDWYASVDNAGVADLEKAAKEFFGKATTTFSPFDRGTFEPLLRTAATNLDANGLYWPDQVTAEDRTLPKPDDKLKITDTWVLLARPRTNNLFLQDLEKLKKQAEETEFYPPAVNAIVTDPDTSNRIIELPAFRGVSATYHSEDKTSGKKARDIYFPKPFNEEQFRIVQLLDISAGVVVQGPPGTGKTHTIANVICHYLAEGKRVLVTSMKDPALREVQEKLPDEIRPLAISLLTSEQEGMKQFEHAIQKIASEVQGLDRRSTATAITQLEESIDGLHGKLASIDRKIGDWAKVNLARITVDAEELVPEEAAREVVGNLGQFEWIPDPLGIAPEFAPKLLEADIVRLRAARRALGRDIDYLNSPLPQLVELPDSKTILAVHRDLSQFEKLKREIENGDVPALADSTQETFTGAQQVLANLEEFRLLRAEAGQTSWAIAMRRHLQQGSNDTLLALLEALGAELRQAVDRRTAFLMRPITVPAGIELDTKLTEAIENQASGRRPFGLKGFFVSATHKQQLDSIRVLGSAPRDAESWRHVAEYLTHLKMLRELALRWNALAPELHLEAVPGDNPESGLAAARSFGMYRNLQRVIKADRELWAVTSLIFPNWDHDDELADGTRGTAALERAVRHHLAKNRLAAVWSRKESFQRVLEGRHGRVIRDIRRFLDERLGKPEIEDGCMHAEWVALVEELSRVLGLGAHLAALHEGCAKVEASGAPKYADLLKCPLGGIVDNLLPDNWRSAWRLRRLATFLESIDAQAELKNLTQARHEVETDLARAYRDIVVKRTWLKLAENASPSIRAALQGYLNAIQKIGKGTGKRAIRYRQDARMAASQANSAVPCWIMPHYRVSESLPAELGCFDLVIIDEASQSDLTALPSLLRAKKILVVGDDKQVSPEGVGLEEEKIRSLMSRFLGNQVETYRPQMSPERSIYDLFKVVFARSAIMLKEHFRCVGPIIEYSKREFYNHELRPLRMPKVSERLDPPLIDVLVGDGYRKGDVNMSEALFIVDEIKVIVSDPNMASRSIGVVSLLGDKQALRIWERLSDTLGPEIMQRHQIACGDARTFQGKERDIMFLSMVSAPNDVGAPPARDTFAQRFNVAASRAKDRMYLVRSVDLVHLSKADRLRRNLIAHFATPFAQDESRVAELRTLCESPFEREVYDELTQRGYRVTPQVNVGPYRIDMVVEGNNDTRLAVECDGDRYHGPDRWADDMQRERDLRRAGWGPFWRCFASTFVRRRKDMIADLVKTLSERGIEPIGAESAKESVHTEYRVVSSVTESTNQGGSLPFEGPAGWQPPVVAPPPTPLSAERGDTEPAEAQPRPSSDDRDFIGRERVQGSWIRSRDAYPPLSEYAEYAGAAGVDPRRSSANSLSEGMIRIIEVEGPVLAKRVFEIYLRGCGIQRMGHELKNTMNKALSDGIRQQRLISESEGSDGDLAFSIVRVSGSAPVRLRTRGPRSFEEIPPSELHVVAKYLAMNHSIPEGSDEHLRAILECFNLKRLTTQVSTTLIAILEKRLPHIDEYMNGLRE